jgi:Xaa-Pro aminopeptidase
MSSALFESTAIVREKVDQAVQILQEKDVDLWLTFVRETPQVKDPIIDLLLGFHVTWHTALLIHRSGERVAIAGRFDVPNIKRLGAYNRVVSYDESFQKSLLQAIESFAPKTIAVNYSENDPAADGLTYGMFRLLSKTLENTPYASRLVSAEAVIAALRGRKTSSEISMVKTAIQYTEEAIAQLTRLLHPGIADVEISDFLHNYLEENGYGSSWEWEYCPVVTVGPESDFGHAIPADLRAQAGNLVHIDFGISRYGFVSDLQRTWYLRKPGQSQLPNDVQCAWDAVSTALEAGRAALKPGVKGWEVDAAARQTLVSAGYPEYMHAFGHHIGRTAHDGATVLGPKWERYGQAIDGMVEEGNIFAIELEVIVPGRGYVSREENVLVTSNGAEYLSKPQPEVWMV